nr:MAG TPA: hypothetical protein [Caudoviricetes sp.]
MLLTSGDIPLAALLRSTLCLGHLIPCILCLRPSILC